MYRCETNFASKKIIKMNKIKNDSIQKKSESMLSKKTNEDFNNEKPDAFDPNLKTKISGSVANIKLIKK